MTLVIRVASLVVVVSREVMEMSRVVIQLREVVTAKRMWRGSSVGTVNRDILIWIRRMILGAPRVFAMGMLRFVKVRRDMGKVN